MENYLSGLQGEIFTWFKILTAVKSFWVKKNCTSLVL